MVLLLKIRLPFGFQPPKVGIICYYRMGLRTKKRRMAYLYGVANKKKCCTTHEHSTKILLSTFFFPTKQLKKHIPKSHWLHPKIAHLFNHRQKGSEGCLELSMK
jgi:hypothetical protein